MVQGQYGILQVMHIFCLVFIEILELSEIITFCICCLFQRFLPGDSPSGQVFSVQGVNVRLATSNEQKVELSDITLQTAGTYMCEVRHFFSSHPL